MHVPPDITVFAARHLVEVDGILFMAVMSGLLLHRHRPAVICWTITSILIFGISLALFRIADAVFLDPRPFVQGHFHPLLPHTANNGFPSGYALLAAGIASAVLFASRQWSIPFVILALLIDSARVGVGFHHVVDIMGSWTIVIMSSSISIVLGPLITAILLPRIPSLGAAKKIDLDHETLAG
jgi:undecaprenyl-diphosphatase